MARSTLQPAAFTNLPDQVVAAEMAAEVVAAIVAPASKNCLRCGTTNVGTAAACMVCKHMHFRASRPVPQRFGKVTAKEIFA